MSSKVRSGIARVGPLLLVAAALALSVAVFAGSVWASVFAMQYAGARWHLDVTHLGAVAEFGQVVTACVGLTGVFISLYVLFVEMRQQREALFQAAFFPGLSLFNQFGASMKDGNVDGQACLSVWRSELCRRRLALPLESDDQCFEAVRAQRDLLLPYCQHLENLLAMINIGSVHPRQKRSYLRMIEAQLSPDGRVVALFYAHSDAGQGMRRLLRDWPILGRYDALIDIELADGASRRVLESINSRPPEV